MARRDHRQGRRLPASKWSVANDYHRRFAVNSAIRPKADSLAKQATHQTLHSPAFPDSLAVMNHADDAVDRWQAADGSWLEMRQMRPDDEPRVKQSLNTLSANSRRNRFFGSIAEFSDEAVHRLVSVDPQKEYLLVVVRREDAIEIPIAGGRFVEHEKQPECTFSLLIGDAWQGQGIGRRLLKALLREASLRGLRTMRGDVLADNRPMLSLARSLHFALVDSDQGDGVVQIVCDLPDAASTSWRSFVHTVLRK